MKFTKQFIDVLSTFNKINKNMYFAKGTIQTSILTGNNKDSILLFARANTNVHIENSFAIGDLSKLISVLKLFDNPEIDIQESSLYIHEGNKQVSYTLSNPEFI